MLTCWFNLGVKDNVSSLLQSITFLRFVQLFDTAEPQKQPIVILYNYDCSQLNHPVLAEPRKQLMIKSDMRVSNGSVIVFVFETNLIINNMTLLII